MRRSKNALWKTEGGDWPTILLSYAAKRPTSGRLPMASTSPVPQAQPALATLAPEELPMRPYWGYHSLLARRAFSATSLRAMLSRRALLTASRLPRSALRQRQSISTAPFSTARCLRVDESTDDPEMVCEQSPYRPRTLLISMR